MKPGSESSVRAAYLAKQGLSVGSIRRMVTYQYGAAPSDRRLAELVAEERHKRERLKQRYRR